MIKALDLEIESMEIEALVKGGDLDGALDLLEKGLGHKYMRRIPTGNPSHPYRYFYSATHGAIPGANPVVGEKVRLDDSGQGGHAEVTHVHDNGEVTLKHDVTGNTMRVHKDRLRDMALEQHGPAIQDRFSRLARVHDQALKTGTARQQERASAALNAHNAAFNAGKYEKNKAHADALSGRYLNDKFTTTHQQHEAMGAHVIAANLAPSDEARASHMGMVQKHSAKLDDLKAKIGAQPPASPNQAPHLQGSDTFRDHLNDAHKQLASAFTAGAADNPGSEAMHKTKAVDHVKAASEMAHAQSKKAYGAGLGSASNKMAEHLKAEQMHQAVAMAAEKAGAKDLGSLHRQRQADHGKNIEGWKQHIKQFGDGNTVQPGTKPAFGVGSAAHDLSNEVNTGSRAGKTPAEMIEKHGAARKAHEDAAGAAYAAGDMAATRIHQDRARTHAVAVGRWEEQAVRNGGADKPVGSVDTTSPGVPRGKTHEDTVKDFKQHFMGTGTTAPKALHDAERGAKFIGDKQTMTKEELKAAPEKIQALKAMAKEHGGKGKAMAALKDARDHWRYMAKLHEGRANSTRNKAVGTVKHDEHIGNMAAARQIRDHLSDQLQKMRLGVNEGKPAPKAAASKPTKERIADRNKIQKIVGKTNPLGAPNNASDRFGPKSFWEGTNGNFEGENEGGKQTTHPVFEPDSHKDLPKGSTLAVYAPHNEKDPSHDFHVYRHEGHGELKPIGRSSPDVNTLADLKGHDVRVSEPGDTRTGHLFANDTIKRLKDSEAKLKGGGGSGGSGGEGGGGKNPVEAARDSKHVDHQLADSDQEHKFAETTGVGKAHTAHDIVSGKAPYKVGDHLSPLHDSKEHAYTIDDYPYGRELRTQKRVWVETKKGHGQRIVEQTKNPKSGGWNKPHPGIYSTLQTASFDENGHLQPHHFHSARGSPEHADDFLKQHGAGLKPSHRQVLQRYAEHIRKHAAESAQKSDPIGDLVKGERMLATGDDPVLLAVLHDRYDGGMRRTPSRDPKPSLAKSAVEVLFESEFLAKGNGVNDEATWEKAKKQALKTYEKSDPNFYAICTSIYKKMGGTFSSMSKAMSSSMLSSSAYAASTMAKSRGTSAAHQAAGDAHTSAKGAHAHEGNHEMAKKHGDVAERHYKEAMAGKAPRMNRSNPTAQTNAALANGAKAGVVRKSEIEGWSCVVPEGTDDRMTHRPRMRRPGDNEIAIIAGAPVVIGPNPSQVRQGATAKAKDEMSKALLGAYRAELMALEADNGLLQAVKKHGAASHRLGVPSPLVKSLNTGEPNPNDVINGATATLLHKSAKDAQLRQGLAILGVTKAHLRQALDAMALTAERVYTGLV